MGRADDQGGVHAAQFLVQLRGCGSLGVGGPTRDQPGSCFRPAMLSSGVEPRFRLQINNITRAAHSVAHVSRTAPPTPSRRFVPPAPAARFPADGLSFGNGGAPSVAAHAAPPTLLILRDAPPRALARGCPGRSRAELPLPCTLLAAKSERSCRPRSRPRPPCPRVDAVGSGLRRGDWRMGTRPHTPAARPHIHDRRERVGPGRRVRVMELSGRAA